MNQIRIRLATPDDISAAEEVIAASARALQKNDYRIHQIESAIRHVYGIDSRLVADGSYYVAEDTVAGSSVVVGCGGWSRRGTLFGGDRWSDRSDDTIDPKAGAAKIRAFFVHPRWARQGIATMLLAASEEAASAHGFTRFEAGATLTGAKFFAARGYEAKREIVVPLGDGISIPIIHMWKEV